MERKLDAGVRSSRSIPRYERPRIVVAPRKYMDVVTPGVASSPTSQPKIGKPTAQPKPQSLPAKYFDVKPHVAPSQEVQRTAPTLEPLTKVVADVVPAPEPTTQPVAVAEPLPAASRRPAVASSPEITKSHAPQSTPEERAEPVAPKKKRKLKHLLKKPTKRHALHGMAALLFVAGVAVSVEGWLANQTVKTQATVLSAQVDKKEGEAPEAQPTGRDALSESKPASVSGYKVAPGLPRAIKIPVLGVNARVLHLGVKKDNSLAAPSSIYDAGWYTSSARPTDAGGAILIDGHVHGPTKPGVFFNLKKLKGGEEIVLERGDGQALTFVVRHVETVAVEQVDMLKLLNSVEPGRLGLNLITCGGEYDAKNTEYKSRTMVFAAQK